MPDLADSSCAPCTGSEPALEPTARESLLNALSEGWSVVEGHHLVRHFEFPDFATALAFVNRVGAIAEEQGHHPEFDLGWGRVRLSIWTHAIDGLTENDFILAAKIDRLSGGD